MHLSPGILVSELFSGIYFRKKNIAIVFVLMGKSKLVTNVAFCKLNLLLFVSPIGTPVLFTIWLKKVKTHDTPC